MIMVHIHLKLHLGLCVGGGRGRGGRVHYKGGGSQHPGGEEVSAHQTLTMGASGRRIAHRVPWGARYRGNGAVGGKGGWGVCVKGWEGEREGAIERCERGQTAGSAAAAFLVRGLGDKLVGVLGCQPRQLRARFVCAGTHQERRADGRSPTNGRRHPPPRWRA